MKSLITGAADELDHLWTAEQAQQSLELAAIERLGRHP